MLENDVISICNLPRFIPGRFYWHKNEFGSIKAYKIGILNGEPVVIVNNKLTVAPEKFGGIWLANNTNIDKN